MDIVCQKLDQQTEDLRQRILNEEKVKECLKYFQKRISKIYDTAHFNAEKIDSRRMKLLILHNAIKFIKYECEKLQQNPALFSSEFGSIIYNEIMEFSERTIAHLQSNVHDCGCNNSDTLSIAPPPSIMSISLYEDSDEVNHSSNENMVAMENDRDIDDDSDRNKQLDQISPFITEKDLQNLNDVVVVKKDDDYEKALPHNDQQFMDMVFIPPSLQNEFEEKFSKINMKKTKELSAKVKMDDNVVSTEDLLKFFYMEKYGKAKKREKDEKMYEDEHFKSWYENKAKGKAHEFVNDKLKLKYDLYTFYKNKYGKSKLLKDERTQMVYFSRSFQSWYEKKLSKKHSSVKKWLNDQKDKVSSITSNSSSNGSDDDNTSAKKVGGTAAVAHSVSCHNIFSPQQQPLKFPNNCSKEFLLNYLKKLNEDDLKKIIEQKNETIYTNLINVGTDPIITPEKQYLGLNHIYESFNFFYKDNDEQIESGSGSGSGSGGASRENKINASNYDKIRLYSDIKHDFKKSNHLPDKELSLTEDSFFHFVISNKQTELITKLWYGEWNEMKNNFSDTGILIPYSHVVLDMRLSNAMTYSPDSPYDIKKKKASKGNYLQELRTYGNLLDPTMNMNMNVNTEELYPGGTHYLTRLSTIMTNFFAVEFPGINITVNLYNSGDKTFSITFKYNSNPMKTSTINDYNGSLVMISKIKKEISCNDDSCKIKPIATTLGIHENKQELFIQMFKSFGDHVQLKEFHEIYKEQKENQDHIDHIVNKTIFGTRDRILIADGIYQDTPIIFKLSNKFNTDIQKISVIETSREVDEDSMEVDEDEDGDSSPQFLFVYTDKNLGAETPISKIMYNKCVYYYNQIHGNEYQINGAYVINGMFRKDFLGILFSIVVLDEFDDKKKNVYKEAMKSLYELLYGVRYVFTESQDESYYTLIHKIDLGFAILKQHVLLLKLHADDNRENNINYLINSLNTNHDSITSVKSKRSRDRYIETYNNQVETLRTIGNTYYETFETINQKLKQTLQENLLKIQNMGLTDYNIGKLLSATNSLEISIKNNKSETLEKINAFKLLKLDQF